MKKKTWIIATLAALILAGVYALYQSNVDRGRETDDQAEQQSAPEDQHTDKNDSETKHPSDRIQGKANIPFEAYNQVYKSKDPYLIEDFDKKNCQESKTEVSYSHIEFVFLERQKDGSFKPFEIDNIQYRTLFPNYEKCGYSGSAVGMSKKYATNRVKFAVVKGCKCPGALKPKKNYSIQYIRGLKGEYNYKFEVPDASQLDMVPIDSDRKPEPYRFPILMSDFYATEIKRGVENEEVSITLKNVTTPIPNLKAGEISDYYVYYNYKHDNSTREIHTRGFKKSGRYKLNTRVRKNTDIMGGNAGVLGIINHSQKIPEQYRKSRESLGINMLMYKRSIHSSTVDMSEETTYKYDPDKSVMKEISLENYIQKNEIDLDKKPPINNPNAKLYKIIGKGSEKEGIRIFTMVMYRKEGEWRTILEAAPGEYGLTIGRKVVDKNFKWPPK